MCLVAILEATNYSQYHEKPTITPNITSPQLHPISQEEAHNYKKRPSCMNIFTRLASLSTVYPTSIPKEKKKPWSLGGLITHQLTPSAHTVPLLPDYSHQLASHRSDKPPPKDKQLILNMHSRTLSQLYCQLVQLATSGLWDIWGWQISFLWFLNLIWLQLRLWQSAVVNGWVLVPWDPGFAVVWATSSTVICVQIITALFVLFCRIKCNHFVHRQAIGGLTAVWNNVTNTSWIFLKEISSDGDVSTVSRPIFVLSLFLSRVL